MPSHDAQPEPAGIAAPRHRGGRNLPVAIASGVTMAALFFLTLWWSPWAFLTFVAVLVLIGLLELDGAFRGVGLRPATPVAVGAGLLAFYGAYGIGATAQTVGVVLLVIGTFAWTLIDPRRDRVVPSIGATLLAGLWVPILASYLGLLLARDDGAWYVMAAVALSVTGDIGAYGVGHAFGKHKMAPSVSPGKTWEGTLGGIATVVLIAALVTSRLPGFDLGLAVVFGLGVAIAAVVGDLSESLVKRDLGVKDLGSIVPGHGGIMDRVDAIVFALPVAHLILLAFGR